MLKKVFLIILFYSLAYADWEDKITVNGYFSFEYECRIDSNDNTEGDPNGSFDSDLFDLVFNIRPTDNIRIAADLTWEHGSATEDSRGNVAVEYAFAEYIKSEAFKIRTGKMYTPFGIYNEIHTAKPATVNYKEPLSTNKIYKIGGDINYFPRWGTGLALTGQSDHLEYAIHLTNGYMEPTGDGYNPYDADDNTKKALSARMKISTQKLELGFSFYRDDFVDYNATQAIIGEGEIQSYGLHLIYEFSDNFKIQIEGVGGTLSNIDHNDTRRYSYSVMPIYDIFDDVRIYYMYEFFDPNTDLEDDTVSINTLGLNIEVAESTFLKCEVYDFTSQKNNTKLNGNDYTEFRAAFVVGF